MVELNRVVGTTWSLRNPGYDPYMVDESDFRLKTIQMGGLNSIILPDCFYGSENLSRKYVVKREVEGKLVVDIAKWGKLFPYDKIVSNLEVLQESRGLADEMGSVLYGYGCAAFVVVEERGELKFKFWGKNGNIINVPSSAYDVLLELIVEAVDRELNGHPIDGCLVLLGDVKEGSLVDFNGADLYVIA